MQRKSITFAQVQASAKAAGLTIAAHEGDGIYHVPSATAAGACYTVVLGTAGPVCGCPAPVGTCWHGARAQELAVAAAPRCGCGQPSSPVNPRYCSACIQRRAAAAMDDLFTRKAA